MSIYYPHKLTIFGHLNILKIVILTNIALYIYIYIYIVRVTLFVLSNEIVRNVKLLLDLFQCVIWEKKL